MIVFLDFDGVLHPEPCADDELFCHLPSIEEVLREFPHVLVVISSAWRLAYRHRPISRLRKYFSQDIARRIVGMTPDYRRADEAMAPRGLGLFLRQWECIGWFRPHRPPGIPWIAIDDRDYLFQPCCSNLILCDSAIGFTAAHAGELRARLGKASLRDQVHRLVQESGRPAGFDANAWLKSWLEQPLPALGGAMPGVWLDKPQGQAMMSSILARMQSGAYGKQPGPPDETLYLVRPAP